MIYSQADFDRNYKDRKKNAYCAYSLISGVYINGNSLLKMPKNHRKAYALIKYWERKKKEFLPFRTLFYHYLAEIYKEAKKMDKWYKTKIMCCLIGMEDKNTDSYHRYLFEYSYLLLSKAYVNDKVKDLNKFNEGLNSLYKYLNECPKNCFASYTMEQRGFLENLFQKHITTKKYLEHYFSTRYDRHKLLRLILLQDYETYIDLLTRDGRNNSSLVNYLKDKLNYINNPKDPESIYKYTKKYIEKSNEFEEYVPEHVIKFYIKAYDLGYNAALTDILNQLRKLPISSAKNYCLEHLKKHQDLVINLFLADIYYEENIKFGKVVNKKDLLKAIKIYEDNLDTLTKNRKERLAEVYKNGYGVEVDLDKAKSLTESAKVLEEIKKVELAIFDNIKVKDKIFSRRIEELKQNLYTSSDEKLVELYLIMFYHLMVEENTELTFKLAEIINNINPLTSGPYVLANCYLYGVGVEKDIDKFKEFIKISMDNNYDKAYNLYYIYIRETEPKNVEALKYLEKAIEFGSLSALYNKGVMLKYGILVKKDEKLAFELIKESYDKGRIESAYELGNYYIEGVCVEKDIKKAYEYYKKAADYSNHLKATKQLYVLIVNSNYTLATEKVAVSYLLRLKENNDLVAYDLLGVRYYYGMGVEKDIKKAYTYMQKCEELENARSTATLAYLYKVGNKELKIPTDYKKSEKLYKRTIKNGEHENYYQLGSLYYLYLKDYKKAYNTFIEGYNLGYINNAAYLGEMYIKGLYVEEDIEKGINYLEEAASVKDIYAVKLLAGYYFGNSDLIERDISKTIFYKKILAELNPNDAANLAEIGICYGMQQDYKNSYEYTNRAYKLDNNNKDANYNLGFLYENGFHVDKNLNKAIVYYEKALEQKYNLAAYALGFIYSNKDYQYHDVNKALDYFTKALNGGINAAIAYICDIYIWDKKEYKKVFEIATSEKYDPEYVAEALGDLYYNGYYVPVDYDKAYSCYTILENISSSIQYKIGRCYFFGHGVEMDKAKGHELIYLSAKANYKPALKFLNEFFK